MFSFVLFIEHKDLLDLIPLSLVSLTKLHPLDLSTLYTYLKHEDKFNIVRLFHLYIPIYQYPYIPTIYHILAMYG